MKLITPAEQKESREAVKPKRRVAPHPSHERLIMLACDHLTSERVQEAYAAFRESASEYMCEVCGTVQPGKPVSKRPEYPDEPPF